MGNCTGVGECRESNGWFAPAAAMRATGAGRTDGQQRHLAQVWSATSKQASKPVTRRTVAPRLLIVTTE